MFSHKDWDFSALSIISVPKSAVVNVARAPVSQIGAPLRSRPVEAVLGGIMGRKGSGNSFLQNGNRDHYEKMGVEFRILLWGIPVG